MNTNKTYTSAVCPCGISLASCPCANDGSVDCTNCNCDTISQEQFNEAVKLSEGFNEAFTYTYNESDVVRDEDDDGTNVSIIQKQTANKIKLHINY